MFVQTLIPKLAVEALDKGVLDRLPRLFRTDFTTRMWSLKVTSSLYVVLVRGFPYIQTLAFNFKELLRAEDMLHFLGTGHLHDPEGVAIRIPQDLR